MVFSRGSGIPCLRLEAGVHVKRSRVTAGMNRGYGWVVTKHHRSSARNAWRPPLDEPPNALVRRESLPSTLKSGTDRKPNCLRASCPARLASAEQRIPQLPGPQCEVFVTRCGRLPRRERPHGAPRSGLRRPHRPLGNDACQACCPGPGPPGSVRPFARARRAPRRTFRPKPQYGPSQTVVSSSRARRSPANQGGSEGAGRAPPRRIVRDPHRRSGARAGDRAR